MKAPVVCNQRKYHIFKGHEDTKHIVHRHLGIFNICFYCNLLCDETRKKLRSGLSIRYPRSIDLTGNPALRRPRVVGYYFDLPQPVMVSIFSDSMHLRHRPKVLVAGSNMRKKSRIQFKPFVLKRKIYEWSELLPKQKLLNNSEYYDKSSHNPLKPYEKYPECIPMHKWQEQSFPTCNHIHELSYLHRRLLASGYFRDTFVFQDSGLGATPYQPVAFKTLRFIRRYDAWIYDRHRMDALVLDRMTSSESIIDIYGHCGSAGLYEFGEGDMTKVLGPHTNSTERLKYGKMPLYKKRGTSFLSHCFLFATF